MISRIVFIVIVFSQFAGKTLFAQEDLNLEINNIIEFNSNSIEYIYPTETGYFLVQNSSNVFSWVSESSYQKSKSGFKASVKKVIKEETSFLVAGLMTTYPYEFFGEMIERGTGNVVRLFPDGTYETFGSGVNGTVRDMVLWNNSPAMVGDFTKSGNQEVQKVAIWNALTAKWTSIPLTQNDDVRAIAVLDSKLIVAGLFKRESNKSFAAINWDGSNSQLIGQELDQVNVVQALQIGSDLTLLGNFKFFNSDTVYQMIQLRQNVWKPLKNPNGIVEEMIELNSQLYVRGEFSRKSYLASYQNEDWVYPVNQPNNLIYSFSVDEKKGSLLLNGSFSKIGTTDTKYIARWSENTVSAINLQDSILQSYSRLDRAEIASDGTSFGVLTTSNSNKFGNINGYEINYFSTQGVFLFNQEMSRLYPSFDYLYSSITQSSLAGSNGFYYLNASGAYYEGNVLFKISRSLRTMDVWYEDVVKNKSDITSAWFPVIGKENQLALSVGGNGSEAIVMYKNDELSFVSDYEIKNYFSNNYFKRVFYYGDMLWKNNDLVLFVSKSDRYKGSNLSAGLALVEKNEPQFYPFPTTLNSSYSFGALYDWAGDEILVILNENSYTKVNNIYLLFNTKTKTYRDFPLTIQFESFQTVSKGDLVFITGMSLKINSKSAAFFVSDGEKLYLPTNTSNSDYSPSSISIADDGTFAFYPASLLTNDDQNSSGIAIGTINNLPIQKEKIEVEEKAKISIYPNPFNPEATLSIEMNSNSYTVINIYDSLGRFMTRLYSGELRAVKYDFRIHGTHWASGVYIYQIQTNSSLQTGKLMLIK
ncbi:MAG: T9SS type A sorting domain-containing protein [Bacteroidetes bacterium]|nr:T9SS type A sorting domain-containing protein [Bacteroidota bacterium]